MKDMKHGISNMSVSSNTKTVGTTRRQVLPDPVKRDQLAGQKVPDDIALFSADGANTKKITARPVTHHTELRSPGVEAQSMDGAKFKNLISNAANTGEEMNASNLSSMHLIAEKSPTYIKPGSSVYKSNLRNEKLCQNQLQARIQLARKKSRTLRT